MHKYPANMAMNPAQADCCPNPKLHDHDLNKPCTLCSHSGFVVLKHGGFHGLPAATEVSELPTVVLEALGIERVQS